MRKIIVTNQANFKQLDLPEITIISPRQYFSNIAFSKMRNVKVFNLCSDYRYQSKGYYVSLLAEARGHKPIPDVKNLQDLKHSTILRSLTDDLNDLIQKSLGKLKSHEFILSVYFGRNVARQYDKLSRELYRIFPVPMFRVRFSLSSGRWLINSLKPIPMRDVPDHHFSILNSAAKSYFDKKRYNKQKDETQAFDLAILIQPGEKSPPSDEKALELFKSVAEKHGFFVSMITKEDSGRINEFDALFIRTTTSVNHYSYRIARTAESEGLAVIDDPSSILKCANKVYLAELLQNARINTPKTLIIHSDNKNEVADQLGLPCILKLPDSSFSQGVIKAGTQAELDVELKKMLEKSDLVIGQSYLPTDFDWRIGILDGKALFACKYFMARGHWQIYNWASAEVDHVEGQFETLALDDVPAQILQLAERSAALIGNGLYGVDLKEVNGEGVVIEINDNPNIDHGVEDLVGKDEVYEKVIQSIKRRVLHRISQTSP